LANFIERYGMPIVIGKYPRGTSDADKLLEALTNLAEGSAIVNPDDVNLELKQAELAQGLKQQSLANLHQRGQLLGQNAGIELNRFAAESQNQLANEEMIQKQAFAERQLESQNEERRLATEFGNKKLADARRQRMAALGLNAFHNSNSQSLSARGVDNAAIAQANSDELQRYDRDSDPLQELGMNIVSNLGTQAITGGFGGGNGFNTNPWNRPSWAEGTNNWSPTSSRLVGTGNGGMRWRN